MPTATRLDPTTAHGVMVAACRQLGIDPTNSELIRLGENALFRLESEPIIVRVGRSIDESKKEVRVALWLGANGIAGANLAYSNGSFQICNGFPVTLWKLIEQHPAAPTAADLGHILRQIHKLPESTDLKLPEFTPMPKIDERIGSLFQTFDSSDISFIRERKLQIENDFARIRSPLGWGPIHGDAHIGNLMRDIDGTIRIIDYGDFCIGPREWDASTLAVGYAVGTLSERTYQSFVEAYGFDALQWDGFPAMQAARELNMTTWLMQLAGNSSEIDTEIAKRLADLRSGRPRRWKPF